jgi:[NiFe] hydrogenase assembly HybE family chaperone
MNATSQARVAQLEQTFAQISSTRMQGIPLLNTFLHVQAVGFEALAEGDAQMLEGILITPWFMNLLRLPLAPAAAASAPEPGSKHSHLCGAQWFEFIAAHENALGSFEACSLFSPMFEFVDQASAVSTAIEILKLLRTPPQATATAKPCKPDKPAMPDRRGFLLGRSSTGATP